MESVSRSESSGCQFLGPGEAWVALWEFWVRTFREPMLPTPAHSLGASAWQAAALTSSLRMMMGRSPAPSQHCSARTVRGQWGPLSSHEAAWGVWPHSFRGSLLVSKQMGFEIGNWKAVNIHVLINIEVNIVLISYGWLGLFRRLALQRTFHILNYALRGKYLE